MPPSDHSEVIYCCVLGDAQRLSARPDGRQASVVVQLLQQHFSRALMSGDDLGSVLSRPCQAWLWRRDRAIVLRGSGVTLQLALLLDLAQELLLLLERAAQPLRRLAVAFRGLCARSSATHRANDSQHRAPWPSSTWRAHTQNPSAAIQLAQ
jgi:hypothetical protein